MKITAPFRRLTVAAVTAPLLVAGLSAPAQAVNDESDAAASWLADQLTDGLVFNQQFTSNDLGLSLDVYFALDAIGVEGAAKDSIITAMADNADTYLTFDTPGELYAGAAGKLGTAVIDSGADPRAFGGRDLVADIESRVATAGEDTGRATDLSAFGDFSNAIGQSWVVKALVGSESDLADEAAGYLAAQQCADGGFSSNLNAATCTSSVDSTTFAVEGLLAADQAEVGDFGDVVSEAADYLVEVQAADGSFGSNTNSTGKAALVLSSLDRERAAVAASSWVHRLFVGPDLADSALGDEIGAVAFDEAAFALGLQQGIVVPTRDQWIRAAAQAAPALDLVEGQDLYTDVPASLTFFFEITWLSATGITTGYEDGTFRPAEPVLREQMAAFLYRFADEPTVERPAESPFTDVSEDDTFYDEIIWLESTGITTGYDEADGTRTFRPSQPVLREQMAAFLYRFDEQDFVDDDGATFTDVAPAFEFFDEIEWLATTGITTGYEEAGDTVTFRGAQPVLREQMAAFLFRYDQYQQSDL